MKWKKRTLDEIAEMICGNVERAKNGEFVPNASFKYRSSFYLTRFFEDAETKFTHDGTTRSVWVSDVLERILTEPRSNAQTPPAAMLRVIQTLMDIGDAASDDPDRKDALAKLNTALSYAGIWVTG
jgi:hypothetical protein